MERFLDFVLRQLVEFPDEMVIHTLEEPKRVVYRVRLAQSDVGKIVGKGGHTIQSIRNLLAAGAAKKGLRAHFEIVEDERRGA